MDQPRHKQSGRGATLPGYKARVRKDYGTAISSGYVKRFIAEQLKVEKRHVNKVETWKKLNISKYSLSRKTAFPVLRE